MFKDRSVLTLRQFLTLVFLSLIQIGSAKATEIWDTNESTLETRQISFETSEGTWMSVDLAPDGERIAFDLLGDLYVLNVPTGEVLQLTAGMAWDQGPRFSEDGTSLFFVSDRVGHKNIWRVDIQSLDVDQVTHFCYNITGGLDITKDGSSILFALSEDSFNSRLFEYSLLTETVEAIDQSIGPLDECGGPISVPVGAGGGTKIHQGVYREQGHIYYDEVVDFFGRDGRSGVRIFHYDRVLQETSFITFPEAEHDDFGPKVTREGSGLIYFRQYRNSEVEIRTRDLQTGSDRHVAWLENATFALTTRGMPSRPTYTTTLDDSAVILWNGGVIQKICLETGETETIPFAVLVERDLAPWLEPRSTVFSEHVEASTIRWPSFTPDRGAVVFAAFGHLWIKDLDSGELRRLSSEDEFVIAPTVSPDGRSIAFTSVRRGGEDFGVVQIVVTNLQGDSRVELLTDRENSALYIPFFTLKWALDGSKIAFANFNLGSSVLEIGWISVHGGGPTYLEGGIRSNYICYFPSACNLNFSEDGDHLFLSVPQSLDGLRQIMPLTLSRTILYSVDMATHRLERIAAGDARTRSIIPQPNLETAILIAHNGEIALHRFNSLSDHIETINFDEAERFSEHSGAQFVHWNGAESVAFGIGQNIFLLDAQTGLSEDYLVEAQLRCPIPDEVLAFQGGRLVAISDPTGAGPVIENGTIVVSGGRILAIGRANEIAVPESAIRIDVSGSTIVPGLLDTHYHNLGSSFYAAMPNRRNVRDGSLTYGVTGGWDPGTGVGDSGAAFVDYYLAGRIEGPRWSSSDIAIGRTHELFIGTQADFAELLQLYEALGTTLLKEYELQTRTHRQWLAAEAFRSDLAIVSHIEFFDQMLTLAVDGYTGGDHPYVPVPLYRDVRQLLAQSDYIWTPNLIIGFSNNEMPNWGVGNFRDQQRDYFSVVEAHFPDQLEKFEEISARNIEVISPLVPYESRIVSRRAASIAAAASDGVRIGVSGHGKPGFYTHMEMWHLWRGGMPIEDVLRAATMTNAEKIGWQNEVGSLEPGKLADFLILRDNPLDNILNTLSIEYTIQGGVFYDADTAERIDPADLPPCDVEAPTGEVCRVVTPTLH